jgi:hypothetical protein
MEEFSHVKYEMCNVQTKLHKDMKVMILVDVATATSHFLSIQYTEHFCGYFFRIYSWFARQNVLTEFWPRMKI